MRAQRFLHSSLALSFLSLAGCGGGPEATTGTGGAGGTGGQTTSSTTGGTSTGGTSTGGTSTGGGNTCTPGESQSCYDGPAATMGVGLCKAGTKTCKANGDGFGECSGQVLPQPETCATPGDDDCNGMANEGGTDCSCSPGTIQACYSGPPDTQNVGPCVGGMQTCNADGKGYGACTGEVTPVPETCLTAIDDNCDGKVNEGGDGCVCTPNAMINCYSGPAATENVGDCKDGKALCNADGTQIGPCMGEVTPQAETCLQPGDEDCNGMTNEGGVGCVCTPGTMVSCYSGPMGTLGIGLCTGGMQMCDANGMPSGPCVGEVTPVAESCLTPGDDNCNGQVNESGLGCSCNPGTAQPCYSGPMGTEGVGTCKAGSQTCAADGKSYGPCTGEVLPAAENCNTPANEDCSMAVDCGTGYWAKSFGTTGDQVANAITRDAQNNVVFTGRFTGFMTFGGNMLVSPVGNDVFVAKFDTNGTFVWSKRFGDASVYQEGFDVAVDASGNVFNTGYFDGSINFGGNGFTSGGLTDIYIVKLDADGNHLWSKSFPAPSPQYGASLAVDNQGNVIILANGFNTVDFGGGGLTSAGSYDIFVAKLDGVTGNHMWSKRFGSPNDDRGVGVAVDSMNNVVFAARSDAAIDFGGGSVPPNGGLDAIVVKLNSMGNFVWAKRYGDGGNQFSADVAIDAQDNVLLTGGFEGGINFGGGLLTASGPIDAFVAKLTSAGNHVWSKHYGANAANLSLVTLAVDTAGDVTAGGSLDGSINFGGGQLTSTQGADALLLHIGGANGTLLWSRLYGSAATQYITGVTADSMKNILVAGHYETTLDFGTGNILTSTGNLDLFLAKLAP